MVNRIRENTTLQKNNKKTVKPEYMVAYTIYEQQDIDPYSEYEGVISLPSKERWLHA